MFFSRPAGLKYVDGYDPDRPHYMGDDFTLSGDWEDLNISSHIQKGAVFVFLRVTVRDTVALHYIAFRTKGNIYIVNQAVCYEREANKYFYYDVYVHPNADGIIQYKTDCVSNANILVTVGGCLV